MSLKANWTEVATEIAYNNPEESTTDLAQRVLEETYLDEDPDAIEVELAYTEIRGWLITYMACNPDT